ncbi:hypothetical protein [Paraburkholderia lycopersici]|uniref:hypothetical protein n=1 Tax=Paraburkholderia lycopersici TaxID=416944 RepID=UPI001C40B1F8|nr:hypothetical protein [Paraburkholderia lycopersici]
MSGIEPGSAPQEPDSGCSLHREKRRQWAREPEAGSGTKAHAVEKPRAADIPRESLCADWFGFGLE